MNKEAKISVAMAVFNGEKYLKEQIYSILVQLKVNDELVISVDESSDGSLEILKQLSKEDNRIKLIKGPNKGVIKNFERAILNCKGDYIFLSDQDDLWVKDKISKVKDIFKNENVDLVLHDAKVADKDLNVIYDSFFKLRKSKPGILKNIFKNSYIGCCMAFKRELLDEILPIPIEIHMHDQWIGIISDIYGKTTFLNETLLLYRRHGDNVSMLTHYPVSVMLKNRFILMIELVKRRVLHHRNKNNR